MTAKEPRRPGEPAFVTEFNLLDANLRPPPPPVRASEAMARPISLPTSSATNRLLDKQPTH